MHILILHTNLYFFLQLSLPTFTENTTNFQRVCIQTYYELFVLQHIPPPQGTLVGQRIY